MKNRKKLLSENKRLQSGRNWLNNAKEPLKIGKQRTENNPNQTGLSGVAT